MSSQYDDRDDFVEKIIGLGETSLRKNYYPELKKRIAELEKTNEELSKQIKARETAEKALIESKIWFDEIFNSTKEAILIYDFRTSKLVEANKHAVELYEYDSKEDLIAAPLGALNADMNIYSETSAIELWEKVLNGEPQFVEWLGKKKDGTIFWVEVALKSTKLGKDHRVLAIVRDISERKLNELKIKENEELLSNLISNSPLGMHFYDLNESDELVLSYANPSADKLLGLDHNDFIGMKIGDAFPSLKETEIPKIYKDIAINGTHWTNQDVYYEDKRITGAFDVIAFQTKPRKMVAVFNDITQRLKAEEEIRILNSELEQRVFERTEELNKTLDKLNESNFELKELNEQITNDSYRIIKLNEQLLVTQDELQTSIEAKNKFFSIIAHDLKGPFSGFIGLTDLLAKETDELSVKEIKKLSRIVNNAANSMFKLLEDLLEWSRMQMGNMPFAPEEVNIFELAFNTVFTLNEMALNKRINIKLDIDQAYKVIADRNMITTVLRNLVSNAIKFTGEDGNIIVGTKGLNENLLVMYVKDSGVGIPDEVMPKLFEIDRSFKTTGTNKETGTGLGLVLCREFVEKNGGRIWAESIRGEETIFFFTLPVKQ